MILSPLNRSGGVLPPTVLEFHVAEHAGDPDAGCLIQPKEVDRFSKCSHCTKTTPKLVQSHEKDVVL